MTDKTMTRPHRRQRWILVLLVILFVLPIALSWFLFKFTTFGQGGGGNYGNLIQPPRQLPDLMLSPIDPQVSGTVRLHGKWTLVYLVNENCGDTCKDNLYRMRQLRLAQGRHGIRVQRLLLALGESVPSLEPGLASEYPGQLLARGNSDLLDAFRLSGGDRPLQADRLYLVDPRGFLMMSYPPGAEPDGIIDDLERLLRYSSVG